MKNEQRKRKQTSSICFVNLFKIPRKQVQDCSKEFLGNNGNNNNKNLLGKATGHNDHYMINTSSQRSRIGGNWPLTGP